MVVGQAALIYIMYKLYMIWGDYIDGSQSDGSDIHNV